MYLRMAAFPLVIFLKFIIFIFSKNFNEKPKDAKPEKDDSKKMFENKLSQS
jgi:hypothetical protein